MNKVTKSIDGIPLKKKNFNDAVSIDGIARKSVPQKSAERKIAVDEIIDENLNTDKKAKIEVTELVVEEKKKSTAEDFLAPVEGSDIFGDEKEADIKDNKEKSLEELLAPKKKSKDHKKSGKKSTKKSTKKERLPFDELEIDGEKVKCNKKKDKKKGGKKKVATWRWIVSSIALFIVLALLGGVIYIMVWGNDIIQKITGGQSDIWSAINTFLSDDYIELKTDSRGRTNILAFGTSGYNMEGDEGNGTHAGAQLTDSIMVISLNQKTGDVAMVSLPRDLKASPTCTATGKINEVYWCNNMRGDNEQAGAQALMNEVGSILGVDFQYYIHVNWGSLITIVDTLGGITVTLDEDVEDYYYTGTVIRAGVPTTLNGEQALGLARARHGTTGGDFSRGMSQQKILIGIKDKVFEKDFSLSDTLTLINTLGDNLRSNLIIEEYKTGVRLTYEFDFNSMRNISLLDWSQGIHYMKTANINGISYVIPYAGEGNYGDIKAYIAKNFSNNPLDYETANISILNATDRSGLAGKESDKLTELGYHVRNIANAPEDLKLNDEYTIYSVTGNYSGTKKALEDQYGVIVKSADELPAGIDTAGYDFVIILGGQEKYSE